METLKSLYMKRDSAHGTWVELHASPAISRFLVTPNVTEMLLKYLDYLGNNCEKKRLYMFSTGKFVLSCLAFFFFVLRQYLSREYQLALNC